MDSSAVDDVLIKAQVEEGQYTLPQRFREFCSGRPFSDLPTCFGLERGSWDHDAKEFGIDPDKVGNPIGDCGENTEGVLPLQFVAALEARLQAEEDLQLKPAELRLLFSQHSWKLMLHARRYIESKLPPGWMYPLHIPG